MSTTVCLLLLNQQAIQKKKTFLFGILSLHKFSLSALQQWILLHWIPKLSASVKYSFARPPHCLVIFPTSSVPSADNTYTYGRVYKFISNSDRKTRVQIQPNFCQKKKKKDKKQNKNKNNDKKKYKTQEPLRHRTCAYNKLWHTGLHYSHRLNI